MPTPVSIISNKGGMILYINGLPHTRIDNEVISVSFDSVSVALAFNGDARRFNVSDYSFDINGVPVTGTSADIGGVFTAFFNSRAYIQTAEQMLALEASKGGLPVAMAAPPTVSSAASSTITGTETVFGNNVFTYVGTAITTTSTVGSFAQAGNVDATAQLAGYRTGGVLEVHFYTDAPQFEIKTYTTGKTYRVFVDGQAVSLTPTVLANTFQLLYIKIDLTTSAQRKIVVQIDHLGVFGGIKVPNNYSLWKSPIHPLRGMILGTSYTGGVYGDGTTSPMLGFAKQLGYKLGIADWFISGDASSDYLKVGLSSGKTPRGRMATDIIAYAPDYLMVELGINAVNNGATAAQLQAEVTTFYTALFAALPNIVVTVLAPFKAPTLNPSQTIADAISAGVAAMTSQVASKQLMYVDTYSEAWQSGTGKVGATSGTGNSNIYIGTDGGHPVQAGHDYLAQRTYAAAINHAKSVVAMKKYF